MTYWKDKEMEEEYMEDYCMKDTPYATRNHTRE